MTDEKLTAEQRKQRRDAERREYDENELQFFRQLSHNALLREPHLARELMQLLEYGLTGSNARELPGETSEMGKVEMPELPPYPKPAVPRDDQFDLQLYRQTAMQSLMRQSLIVSQLFILLHTAIRGDRESIKKQIDDALVKFRPMAGGNHGDEQQN